MMSERCKHGMDQRFCSLCATPRPAMRPQTKRDSSTTSGVTYGLEDVVRFLNDQQIRATYGAVAEVVGGIAQGIGARLTRLYSMGPEASWVVNAESGMPTGYQVHQGHPALLSKTEIIRSGAELERRLARWKSTR